MSYNVEKICFMWERYFVRINIMYVEWRQKKSVQFNCIIKQIFLEVVSIKLIIRNWHNIHLWYRMDQRSKFMRWKCKVIPLSVLIRCVPLFWTNLLQIVPCFTNQKHCGTWKKWITNFVIIGWQDKLSMQKIKHTVNTCWIFIMPVLLYNI